MTPLLLDIADLHVAYGAVEALHGIDLHLREGEIVTVIGPNGAGKTTLLGATMGLLPSRGRIAFAGEPIKRPSVEAMVACGVALVPERRELFGEMSVADNLLLGSFAAWRRGRRDSRERLAEVHAIFPRLAERGAQLASTLSGGERQMLAIGRALMSRPRLLMLDEPSLGLAPLVVHTIFEAIDEIRGKGTTILLVEQNAHAALGHSDRAYVLETGRIVMEGPSKELAADPRIKEAYLGE